MNYLVYLNAQEGELEKILSGTKTMLVKEFDPAHPVNPGDSLYFLRDDKCTIRVKATVIWVLPVMNFSDEDTPLILKERQSKLQLTEGQYNHWSAKKQALLVEFEAAHKIGMIQVDRKNIPDQPDWVAFEEISLIT